MKFSAACFLMIAIASPRLAAQVRVTGRVTSETDAPVAGAQITAHTVPPSTRFEATSDPTGAFTLTLPKPVTYSLTIDREDDHRFMQFFELNLFGERQFAVRGYALLLRGGFNNITGHQNSTMVDNVVVGPTFLREYGGQARAVSFRLRFLGKQ